MLIGRRPSQTRRDSKQSARSSRQNERELRVEHMFEVLVSLLFDIAAADSHHGTPAVVLIMIQRPKRS